MKTDNRVVGLDFLRGSAAFCVALPHFFMALNLRPHLFETISVLGVELFFVLSGFVLAPQICMVFGRGRSKRNIAIFWVRRWMRTVPAYVIAMLAVSITAHEVWSGDFFRYLFYVQNLLWQSNKDDYFTIAWSLSVEEWFYLSFPVFLALASLVLDLRDPRRLMQAALAFIAIITLARTVGGDYSNWGGEVRRVVVYRVDSIAYGFLLYLAIQRADILRHNVAIFVTTFAGLFAGGFLLTEAITPSWYSLPAHLFPFYEAFVGAAAILLALRLNTMVTKSRALTALGLFLGRISYSVYLFHLVLLNALVSAFPHASILISLLVYVLILIALAALMYYAVEKPILVQRPAFERSPQIALEILGPSLPLGAPPAIQSEAPAIPSPPPMV